MTVCFVATEILSTQQTNDLFALGQLAFVVHIPKQDWAFGSFFEKIWHGLVFHKFPKPEGLGGRGIALFKRVD